MTTERPFEKKCYDSFRSKLDNIDLPESWDNFLTTLRFQLHYGGNLTEMERNVLWQAGTSFKVGCELIEIKKIHNCFLKETAVELGGLQLIIYGTFLQLKGWVNKLRGENRKLELLGKIKKYIGENDRLKELRNAVSHSGDNDNTTYFFFSNNQTIRFKTRQTNGEMSINVFEVLFASLLLWMSFRNGQIIKLKQRKMKTTKKSIFRELGNE
jgi:hypothetical protein